MIYSSAQYYSHIVLIYLCSIGFNTTWALPYGSPFLAVFRGFFNKNTALRSARLRKGQWDFPREVISNTHSEGVW